MRTGPSQEGGYDAPHLQLRGKKEMKSRGGRLYT